MNARPTEFRTTSDLRAQRELESLLAARHAATAAREERYRRLRTPLSESLRELPRKPFRQWFAEQMQIPEAHETLWLLAFSVVTLCIGLLALWSTP